MVIRHISFADRVKIETYIHEHYNLSEIAMMLGFSRAAITKELQRAVPGKLPLKIRKIQYRAVDAQYFSDQRKHTKCGRKTKLTVKAENIIYERIKKDKWSPEQIVNAEKRIGVSTSSIYNWINQGKVPKVSNLLLRRKGKRYKRAVNKRIRNSYKTSETDKRKIIQKHNIEQRPLAISSRKHFGHWEMDGVESRKSNTLLLTFVERKTRYAKVLKVKSKHAEDIAAAINDFLNEFDGLVKSITCDRGSEFMATKPRLVLEQSGVKYYYAHAYSPYERGSNENFNGLLREFIPNGTNLDSVSESKLQKIVSSINHRPMKLHRYKNRQTAFIRQLQYLQRYKSIKTIKSFRTA